MGYFDCMLGVIDTRHRALRWVAISAIADNVVVRAPSANTSLVGADCWYRCFHLASAPEMTAAMMLIDETGAARCERCPTPPYGRRGNVVHRAPSCITYEKALPPISRHTP